MFGCMKIVFYIIGCLSFSSCWYPFPNAYERSMQAGRFHPDINTHIDEKVNIDGYYVREKNMPGSPLEPFILYTDGTYGGIYFRDEDSTYEQKRPHTSLLNEILISKRGFNAPGGYYKVKNDTIEVNFYLSYMLRIFLIKRLFKILDRNHLLFFQQTWVMPKGDNFITDHDVLYQFVPADNLPPSTNFAGKLRRYLWENKKDWKAYKRRMKEVRKENRQ